MVAVDGPSSPERLGRSRIVEELGVGGMGTIYLARIEALGGFERLVALKLLHDHLGRDQAFIRMFLDEARLAARIRHPNVVSVQEVAAERGRYFITMEYVSGESMSFLLAKTPKDENWPLYMMARIVAQACEGLHAAHELTDVEGQPLGVVHRDVSPDNVLVGYDGSVRVTDFGIAKAADQLSQTLPGIQKGKIAYMSPEQIRMQPTDRRSDIFGLGVMLWEGTVGRRLFKSRNQLESAARVLRGDFTRPGTYRENYPPELERIVMKALELDPERRYATARDMGRDIQAAIPPNPDEIEHFMKSAFRESHIQRLELERRASRVDSPIEIITMVTELPNFKMEETLDGDSLVVEDVDWTGEESPAGNTVRDRAPLAPTEDLLAPVVAPFPNEDTEETEDGAAEASLLFVAESQVIGLDEPSGLATVPERPADLALPPTPLPASALIAIDDEPATDREPPASRLSAPKVLLGLAAIIALLLASLVARKVMRAQVSIDPQPRLEAIVPSHSQEPTEAHRAIERVKLAPVIEPPLPALELEREAPAQEEERPRPAQRRARKRSPVVEKKPQPTKPAEDAPGRALIRADDL